MKIKEGQKYVVRSIEAGVFYGEIIEQDGAEVTLKNAKCIWYWKGANTLNNLAGYGIDDKNNRSKITPACEEIVLMNVCEIIPLTDQAFESLESVAVWK